MNKMNKKGFTLIEMLVVIAIIAILVSIIVPVVGNSTKKAAAATNAANLRSTAASIAVAILSDKIDSSDGVTNDEITAAGITIPTAKTNGGVTGGAFSCTVENGQVICKFGSMTIDDYAALAS